MAGAEADVSRRKAGQRDMLLWIVLGAFLVQLAGWALWYTIATHHRVAEVPLTTRTAR